MAATEVRMTGPLFDGSAAKAVSDFCEESQQQVAEDGVTILKGVLHPLLQNPTGRYESKIQAVKGTRDAVINDGGIVYGPWLAGVSSRNRATRFKGYKHWRLAAQAISERIENTVKMAKDRMMSRLGG